MLKHCAENRLRRLSALPNVGLYIYHVKISGFKKGFSEPRSSVGIVTGYGLDGLGIEFWWGPDFSHMKT
jgi:hypothetical protein